MPATPDDRATPIGIAHRRDPRVAAELYRITLSADRRAALGALLAPVLAGAALQSHGGTGAAIWAWAAFCAALALARLLLVYSASPRADGRAAMRAWIALVAVGALAWGAGAAVFVHADSSVAGIVTGIWLAAAGVSAPLVAASRPAVYLSLLPALLPLVLALAAQSTPSTWVLAMLTAASLLLLLRLALEQNDLLAAEFGARLRNEDLVEQLRAQVDVAARANQEKTRFLASAAHDLRQPLHALGLFCAALEQRMANLPEKPLVRNMMAAIESLENSFGAMLDISRLDAGVVKSAPQSFPIRDTFRRLYQQFGGDAEARDISLRFRAARRIVHSDPLLLERIIGNLLQNALRYTQHGGVLVAARRHPGGLAIEIWDTGIGIPDDKRDQIFEEFYQIDNAERDRTRGLGMGLAIVKRLCKLLGHRLELHSRPGRGSLFRLIVTPGDRADVAAPPLDADTLPPRVQSAVRVLLIDDELAIRTATRELLRPMQVDVLAAGSIAEAVALAQTGGAPIDLILSDWRLRGQENGIAAVAAVRRVTGASTPAVLVTGDTAADLATLAMQNGLVLMHKPLQPRELIRLIKRLRLHA